MRIGRILGSEALAVNYNALASLAPCQVRFA
jgi:hypothetical protein